MKSAIYGIIYGMGNATLAKKISSTVDEAQSLMEKFRDANPDATGYCARVIDDAGNCSALT